MNISATVARGVLARTGAQPASTPGPGPRPRATGATGRSPVDRPGDARSAGPLPVPGYFQSLHNVGAWPSFPGFPFPACLHRHPALQVQRPGSGKHPDNGRPRTGFPVVYYGLRVLPWCCSRHPGSERPSNAAGRGNPCRHCRLSGIVRYLEVSQGMQQGFQC